MSDTSNINTASRLFQGEDKVIDFTVRDTEGGAGSPVDVAGWTVEMVIRDHESAPGASVLTVSTGTGEITLPAPTTNGIVRVTLTDDQTIALKKKDYVYALRRTDAGESQVLAEGAFTARPAATRN